MIWETQYKKYTLKLDGKDTFVYASRNLTLKEAKENRKNRFDNSKVPNIIVSGKV